ncbi:DUF433 domain-containing protein [Brasilonema bromeliae]|uniref:DUF433 domain-containing protein n=1 Tax=Brasilonema bromeliae SPC951 TaxID=385972 RepID=A0ABX1PAF0_9CYAN|nr:DUF433 domain-containing protein [Brasilonema bromeliae]NMG20525.1 hypothetical protein [Brasilonema bromeliae SPC951]
MQLEDYFEFFASDDIRVKGTRIGIEHILDEYIHSAKAPEEIAKELHTVTLEQIYATILFYLHNQQTVEKYMADWLDYTLKAEAEYDKNLPSVVMRLRQLKEQQKAEPVSN